MRDKLLAGVSASAIVLGAFAAQSARADDGFDLPFGDDWYVSIFGGGAFNENAHSNYISQIYEIRLIFATQIVIRVFASPTHEIPCRATPTRCSFSPISGRTSIWGSLPFTPAAAWERPFWV